MLGEDHSLSEDFPEYKDTISRLVEKDHDFSRDTTKYNELDKQIRMLELDDAPISDEDMQQKKLDRAALKDVLYNQLVEAGKS